jgi:hypothetical protein
MQTQVRDVIRDKRTAIDALNALEGDALVLEVCAQDIAQAQAVYGGITVAGEPIKRGAVGAGAPPGWNSARNA